MAEYKQRMEEIYGLEWRLEGEDVSNIRVGYWDEETPLLDISRAQQNYLREVFRHLHPQPDDLLLEIGAGNGATAIWMAETFGCRIHAVDIVELHARLTREAVAARGLQGKIQVTCADIRELSFPAGSFDHAYSLECLHHLANRADVIRKLAGWVRHGGRLVLAEHTAAPQTPWLQRWAAGQVSGSSHTGSLEEYQQVLAATGFRLLDCRDVTQFTFVKADAWQQADPQQQMRRYARRLYGPIAASLIPCVFWLARRAVGNGMCGLHFLTAEKRQSGNCEVPLDES